LNCLSKITCLLLLPFVAACAQNTPVIKPNNELSRINVISVGNNNFSLQRGDQLRWRRDIIWVQDEGLADIEKSINRQNLTHEIEKQLLAKGYPVVSGSQTTQYEIVAAVILGESDRGQALTELARLYPSLGNSHEALEKGTLMLGFSRAGSKTLDWRIAIQALLAEKPTTIQSHQRIERIVAQIMSKLPEKK